jgi:coenzyme F420-reducing hydrogenase beta subunit
MEPVVLGAWSNQDDVRLASSSGGMAYELGHQMIQEGGIVVGCAMGDDLLAHHVIVDNPGDLEKLQGSKYIPSEVSGIYHQAAQVAAEGRKVLFTGTPCQVAAFESYLRPAWRDRVLTASFICHGVPSLLSWKKHLAETFKTNVQIVKFRDKSYGWSSSLLMAYSLKDGTNVKVISDDDVFLSGFLSTIFYQCICNLCPFAAIPRCGDLTLGDFWGIDPKRKDERGVSVVVASTARGLDTIERMRTSGRISTFNSTLAEAAAANQRLICSMGHPHPKRVEAMRLLAAGAPLKEIAKLYQPGVSKRISMHIKKYFRKHLPTKVWAFAQQLKYHLMLRKARLSSC